MDMKHKSFYEFVNSYISEFISQNIKDLKNSNLYKQMLFQFKKNLFDSTMKATDGNQSRAASVIGINRATLRKKIKILNTQQDANS